MLCVFGGLGIALEGPFVFVISGFEVTACVSYVRFSAVGAC